jgi:hypothetical protein
MSIWTIIGLAYAALCLSAAFGFVLVVAITDIRWRYHRKKRRPIVVNPTHSEKLDYVREWKLP